MSDEEQISEGFNKAWPIFASHITSAMPNQSLLAVVEILAKAMYREGYIDSKLASLAELDSRLKAVLELGAKIVTTTSEQPSLSD